MSKCLVSAAFSAPSTDCSLVLIVSLQAEWKKAWREVGMCLEFQSISSQLSWSAKIQRSTQFILKSKGQGSSGSELQGDNRNSPLVLALHSATGLQWTCSKALSHLRSFSWQAFFYREGFPTSFCSSKNLLNGWEFCWRKWMKIKFYYFKNSSKLERKKNFEIFLTIFVFLQVRNVSSTSV